MVGNGARRFAKRRSEDLRRQRSAVVTQVCEKEAGVQGIPGCDRIVGFEEKKVSPTGLEGYGRYRAHRVQRQNGTNGAGTAKASDAHVMREIGRQAGELRARVEGLS